MSESVTESVGTTYTSDSHTTGTSLKLGKVPYKRQYDSQIDILPKLPSHKLRYSVWHDLRETCLTGDQLHAPRVRAGPPEKDAEFYHLDEEGTKVHHSLHGKQRQNHMNTFENWEAAKVINLSYQDLFDDYQKNNFKRILQRLHSAVSINIVHNEMVDFQSVTFPSCEYLNMKDNFIKSFHGFPRIPKVKSLTASGNAVDSFKGLDYLAHTPLSDLTLSGNPVSFVTAYRQKVFHLLPGLQLLDGIPKLPEDHNLSDEDKLDLSRDLHPYGYCTIL